VTRYLFQGEWVGVLPPLFFLSFTAPRGAPLTPGKGFGENDICSQQTRSLSSIYQVRQRCVCGRATAANAFLTYLDPRKRVWWQQTSSFLFS